MRVSAIVVTYNSQEQIGPCIDALASPDTEVWVVDNASGDGTLAEVARRPHVNVIANDENVGFARAVNQGLSRALADVVLLVNPDCIVPSETVAALAGFLEANPDVGIVGPRLRNPDATVAISAHPFETAGAALASRLGGSLVPVSWRGLVARGARRESYLMCREGTDEAQADWLSGACMAVRATLARALGGLDTGYFMYYEDEELCLQAWRAGAKVVYLPRVEAVHAGGASSSDPARVWPHLYRSMLRFHARHRPGTYALLRAGLVLRASIGIATGTVRDTVGRIRGLPARRALAWRRIGRLALGTSRAAAERPV